MRVTYSNPTPPKVSDEERLLREVEASLQNTKLTRKDSTSSNDGDAANAARRAAAAAAAVAGGMLGGLRAASQSPTARFVEADTRRRGETKKSSPFAAATANAVVSSPESGDSASDSVNDSVSVRSFGIGRTPVKDDSEATSKPIGKEKSPLGVKSKVNAKNSPGYRGVSQWMDTVVARAKAMRAGGSGQTDAESLAAAANVAGAESKFPGLRSDTTDREKNVRSPTPDLLSPTSTSATLKSDEIDSSMTSSELRRIIADQKAAMKVIAGKYAQLKETHRKESRAREETNATLAKVLQREESFETELRTASERCVEIESGRRSARAALAEMANQNARLVSAFSAKKEEVTTLRAEVEEQKKAKNNDENSSNKTLEDFLRNARREIRELQQTLSKRSDELCATQSELVSSKREIGLLRDTVDAAKRREAMGEGDAEVMGTKAREETLAARVARKELVVERASFAAERARWDTERKRWATEIASVRASAAAAAAAKGSAGVPPLWEKSEGGKNEKPQPNPAFKDPYKQSPSGASRSQPSSPTRSASFTSNSTTSKAVSPSFRKAQSFAARGNKTSSTHGHRSAPSSPSKDGSSKTSLQKSPGPNASPRRQAEQHKVRGNNEFHAKRYESALAQYTSGLALAFDDDAFRAILHANRAAAYQALKKYCDAIMDCCVSNYLDASYLRALQRRADAYLSMGDWPNAAKDLTTLAPRMGPECSVKLQEAKRKAQKGLAVDHYAVLGVLVTANASEIKQAYRKLALKHHPDKAPSAAPLRAASEQLFKHIAYANAVLSDPAARRKYDQSVMGQRRY